MSQESLEDEFLHLLHDYDRKIVELNYLFFTKIQDASTLFIINKFIMIYKYKNINLINNSLSWLVNIWFVESIE